MTRGTGVPAICMQDVGSNAHMQAGHAFGIAALLQEVANE